MDRRDFAKKAVALGLAPIVVAPGEFRVPRTNRKARLVWLSSCQTPGMRPVDWLPSVDDLCRRQVSKGRHILGTYQEGTEHGLVAIGLEYATEREARVAMQELVRTCCEDSKSSYPEYGLVYAVAHIGAGESFDVQAFLRSSGETRNRSVDSRLSRLEHEARKRG